MPAMVFFNHLQLIFYVYQFCGQREIIEFYKIELHSTSKICYGALPYRANEAMDLRCDIGKLNRIIGVTKLKECLLDNLKK